MAESAVNWSSFVCVGAGAAGALTAARILDRAHDDHRRVDVVLVDPRPTSGRGVAYSTDNPSHLLNVPARSMSAYPDDPTHLLRWLSKRGQRVAPDAFIPRKTYGRYLDDVLATAQRRATGSTLTRARERAVDISWKPGTCRLRLASGTVVGADAVVLALGHLGVTTAWAPEVLRRSARFITDPWAPDRLATVPDGDLLLVGAGLTMVDVVLSLRAPGVPGAPGAPGALGRAIHAISRTGELPRRHAQTRLPAMEPPELSSPASLTELRAAMAEHVALSLRRYGDWRPAVDSIRPLTQQVWRQLSEVDKAHFLAEDARLWDSLRHRVPPRSADVIDEERQAGRLVFHTGRVLDAVESGDRVRVTLSDGSAVAVAAIVNCTGPSVDPQASRDPLVRSLMDSGLARSGPLGLGFDTDDDGRLRDADGVASAPLWTLGSLRRGCLWESTAMPEIRCQAAALANHLVADTAADATGPETGLCVSAKTGCPPAHHVR